MNSLSNEINKHLACRLCRFNVEGKCQQGMKTYADKKDECWMFSDKSINSGIGGSSEVKSTD